MVQIYTPPPFSPNFDSSFIAHGYDEAIRILSEIRALLIPQADQLDEVRTAIDFCSRGIDTTKGVVRFPLYFGSGVYYQERVVEGAVKREISERTLASATERWNKIRGLSTKGSLLNEHFGIASDVSERFRALDRSLGRNVDFSRIAQSISGSIGSPPSDLLAADSALLHGGATYLRGKEVRKLIHNLEVDIIGGTSCFLSEMRAVRLRTNLIVAGICAGLLAGFSLCAYWLGRPAPSYTD